MFIRWFKKLFEILFHLSPTETMTTNTTSKPSAEEQKIYWGEPSKDIDNPEWEVKK